MKLSQEAKTSLLELTGIMQLLQGQDGGTTRVLDVPTFVVAVSRVYPVFLPVFGHYAWVSTGIITGTLNNGDLELSHKVTIAPHAWMSIRGLDDVALDLLPINQVLGAKTPVLINVSRRSKIGTSGFLENKAVSALGTDQEPHILTAIREVKMLRERARRLIITV